jgi:hypothetical protein
MTDHEATTPVEPPDDLISDAELGPTDSDEFGHTAIVDSLADIIEKRDKDRPVNVALYGPWGSGKSSIAAMLARRYEARDDIEFVRFDAFKYAQQSLRRHFLVEMARVLRPSRTRSGGLSRRLRHPFGGGESTSIQLTDTAYRDRLYQSVQRKALALSRRDAGELIKAIAVFVLIPVLLAAAGGAAGWAWLFSALDFQPAFVGALPDMLVLLAVPAAAGLFALVREIVPTATAMAEPSSEEQFESLFRELVDEAAVSRIAVFVDEIDRCSPHEVVETLDTIRTFLGVPGCVFIVAADQRVLEQAISEQVRQTTPDDATNPYYSAGSAYLDKVFQYQFSLPPLLPTTVSHYALGLVQGLPGVWSEIDIEEVVSILVPTHVRSPRRVKALLNNFVLTYRLAKAAGLLTEDDPRRDRSVELAVLVCLQSEFPLFARDLARHPRLPALLRYIYEGELDDTKSESEPTTVAAPDWARDETWARALAYRNGEAFGDQMLSAHDRDDRGAIRPDAPEAGPRLNLELREYLLKTSGIWGPGTDLIFMKDSGGFFGLDPSEAEEIADAAFNNDRRTLSRLTNGFDETARTAVLRFLAARTLEGSFGREGRNMAAALLFLSDSYLSEQNSHAANEVARAIASQQTRRSLGDGEMPGALKVGLLSRSPQADGLVAAVIETGRFRYAPPVAFAILRNAKPLCDLGHHDPVVDALAWAVVQDDDGNLVPALGSLPSDLSRDLASHAVHSLTAILRGLQSAEFGTQTDEPVDGQVEEVHERLTALVERLCTAGQAENAQDLLAAMLDTEQEPLVAIALGLLDGVGPAATSAFQCSAAVAAQQRPIAEIPTWVLAATGPALGDDERERLVDDLTNRLWAERALSESEPEAYTSAVQAVSALQGVDPEEIRTAGSLAAAEFENFGLDLANVDRVASEIRRLRLLEDHDLVIGGGEVAVPTMVAFIGGQPPVATPNRPSPVEHYTELIDEWLPWVTSTAEPESVGIVVEAFLASPWIPSPCRERQAMEAAASAGLDPPLAVDALRALLEAHPANADAEKAVSTWVRSYSPPGHDLWRVLEPHAWSGLPGDLAITVGDYCDAALPQEVNALVEPMIGRLPDVPVSGEYLAAVHSTSGDQKAMALHLAAQATKAKSDGSRRNILDGWVALNPTARDARHVLIEMIAIPFAKRALDGALLLISTDYGKLIQDPPKSIRQALQETLTAKAGGTSSEKRMRSALEDLGIVERPSLATRIGRNLLGR